jgi:hypothetical protein
MLIMKRRLKAEIRTPRWYSISCEEGNFQRFNMTCKRNHHGVEKDG